MNNKILENLHELCKDLYYVSETDAPLEAFTWENSASIFDDNLLRQHLKINKKTSIEVETLEDFLAFHSEAQDWHSEEEKGIVVRFQILKVYLNENLAQIQVFKVGLIKVVAYILGKDVFGNWIGVKTELVQT